MLSLAQAFSKHLPPVAFDADEPKGWITANGAHIPMGENGQPTGTVGAKIQEGSGAASGKSFADYQKAAGGDHYKAAKEFYKNELQGKPAKVNMGELGKKEVQFGGGDEKKKFHHNLQSDPVKAEAVQHVRDALENGKYLGETPSYKTDDKFSAYAHFQKEIPMKDESGKNRKLIVDAGKRPDGKYEYTAHSFIHNQDKRYANKVEHLRNSGLNTEDKKIGGKASKSQGLFIPTVRKALPVSDQKIISPSPRVNTDSLTLDRATLRRTDENGFLHVAASHISKECVNPYYGREIPGWEEAGLDPERVYHGYRSGSALAAGAATFNGLPLLRDHHIESADNPQKEHRVGSLGTDAAFSAPYLDNSLIITDSDAIAAIESGAARELSMAYKYDPVFTPGTFRGEKYDFVMTNIRGNHVALVEEGRAGSDVLVADSAPQNLKTKRTGIMGLIDDIKKLLASAQAEGLAPDPAAEKEGAAMIGGTDEENTAMPAEGEEEAPAEDDEAESLGTELFALIDSITDKELAGKIKALIEKMRGGATDEDPDAAKDEDAEKKAACDEDAPDDAEKKEEKKEGAMDRKLKKRPAPAMDAAAVRKSTLDHVRALTIAARDVRPLLDVTDALAFDSAEDIYAKALKAHGVNTASYPRAALRGMCDMLKSQKAEQFRAAHLSLDAAPKIDPKSPFAGLNNIRVEG